MTAVPIASRNRVNPTFMPAFLAAPQPAYFMPINEYELCRDPNCAVCRGNGQHRLQNQTQNIVSREGSSTSTVSVHSVALDERSSNISEKRLISSRKPTRDVWTRNRTTPDDEIVCCRAYDGCRCPCWCCILLIVLIIILILILIILLATLL